MIKFLRGTTDSWRTGKGSKIKLGPGQPGYDRTKNKLKIGDGENIWTELPYTSGLHAEEILDSEENAQSRKNTDSEDLTLITYGTETPGNTTVGQIYLQQIDDPAVDYIVASGEEGIWRYQKWKSGVARCWCNYSVSGTVKDHLELFWRSATTDSLAYPITFTEIPTETATIQSSSGQVLLVNSSANTTTTSGTYVIVSLIGEIVDAATYRISMQVEGFCEDKKDDDKN